MEVRINEFNSTLSLIFKQTLFDSIAFLTCLDQKLLDLTRCTPRNEPMYMPAGTCYVYQTYGMYFCFNISSKEPGAAVLLRALEPLEGLEIMEKHRKVKNGGFKGKPHVLCNGPSKLCISMNINKENCNKLDLADRENNMLWVEDDPDFDPTSMKIVKTSRIGIASAGQEWATKPLRYYILGNKSVSKRDRKAEKESEEEFSSPYFL